MDDLLQEFLSETREMLAAIASELVAWEADPSDRARLDEIFRFVHTVKGSCGFLDLPRLARLSHAAEDVLGDLRAGCRLPDTALVSAVLGIVDRIGELAEAIGTGESLSDEEDHGLVAALAAGAVTRAGSGPTAAAPPAALHREPSPRAAARTVRLPIELLDRMMASVSDMVLARNELARTLRDSDCDTTVSLAFERLSTCVAEMRDSITRTRMQRLDTIFAALPRMVRDLSAELAKQVTLEIEGGDVELDREMIEMIRDPLTHILRNAIDHGIETPAQRREAGKPQVGRLLVSARHAANRIVIEVVDDGRGIDGEKIVAKAISAGILTAEGASCLSWGEKVELIFEPGLSTADTITTISGRGVGMDVVRANMERIGGTVDVEGGPGQGVRVMLHVPLALTITPALTVSAGGLRFALPRAAIDEIVPADSSHAVIERIGDAEMATISGRRMAVVRLARLLDLPELGGGEIPILVVLRPAGGAAFALALDAVHDHEELVVKPAAPAIMASGLYAGATVPDAGVPDAGEPMLLLDPAGIAEAAGLPLPGHETDRPPPGGADTVPARSFADLDGAARVIPRGMDRRAEDVPADAIPVRLSPAWHGGIPSC